MTVKGTVKQKDLAKMSLLKTGTAEPTYSSWKARITDNPLVDAFDENIVVHPGISSSPVSPKEAPLKLEELLSKPRTQPRSTAYINVPFCETRCLYCMFYIKPYRKEESKKYADTLIKEMQLWADKRAMQEQPVHAVYFGGGTPTALEATDIRRVIEGTRKYLPLANDCEITFEGRLSNFGYDKMEAAVRGGANRFSLGVQSFDTKIRQAVGRRSTKEELISQLKRLMSFNEAAVVVDLIYGFPYQSMETWEEDLAIVEELGLDGADCYHLRVFPGSPLHKYIQNGKLPAGPDHALKAAMFAKSVELMQANQWNRLSISHWGRTFRERNFYNYYAKSRSDCLAFGPGAGGVLHGHSYMMHRKVDDWANSVEQGVKPVSMLLAPSKDWNFSRAISEHMELNFLNPRKLSAEFNRELETLWKPVLENWQEAGLMERQGDYYNLTLAGQFWQTRLTQLLMETLKS